MGERSGSGVPQGVVQRLRAVLGAMVSFALSEESHVIAPGLREHRWKPHKW
jgi:hypothetical protein